MRDEFANRQSMHLTVLNLLDKPESRAVWEDNNPIKFTERVGEFRAKVTALTATIAEKTSDITGQAVEKDREETELEVLAQELGVTFAEYLGDQGREGEAAEFELLPLQMAEPARYRPPRQSHPPQDPPHRRPRRRRTRPHRIRHLPRRSRPLHQGTRRLRKSHPEPLRSHRHPQSPHRRPPPGLPRSAQYPPLHRHRLVLRFRTTPEGKAFAANWKTARTVRDLGSNNPDPEPPTP